MNNDLKGITIVCPVYNKKQYIIQTIESVQRQTSKEWELILIDDGSTDGSYNLISSYLEELSEQILLVDRKVYSATKGANSCRNIGAKLAKYDKILFLDADDLLLESSIQKRLESIEKTSKADIYIFGVAYAKGDPPIAYQKTEVSARTARAITKGRDLREEFLVQFLSFVLPWHTSGPVWDKRFFESIGGFNEDFQRLQDPEIHIRALLRNDLRLHFFTHQVGFDALHRKDDDRQIYDEHTFFIRQVHSVAQFVELYDDILTKKDMDGYKKYLVNYLIFAETICYRLIRDNKDVQKNVYFEELENLYKKLPKSIAPLHYKLFVKYVVRNIERSNLLLRKKIPGLLLELIKRKNG